VSEVNLVTVPPRTCYGTANTNDSEPYLDNYS